MTAAGSTVLRTDKLSAGYGDFRALFDVDMRLEAGEVIAIIGANSAGKSTLLKAICGLVSRGKESVIFEGKPIGHLRTPDIMKLGIAMVPEGRKLFPSLNVEENLLIGAHARNAPGYWTLPRVQALFPLLKERRTSAVQTLSGGQQQMVAIGRALMSNPKVLLCDEISLGLAPVVVKDIYRQLPQLKAGGASILIVEQDIGQALSVANRVYCLMEGRVTLEGKPKDLSRERIHDAYFGGRAAA